MKPYDAILIPGGGIRDNGDLPVYVKNRLDRAMEVHTNELLITLSAGTTHKPPFLDKQGFPLFESVAAAAYLKAHTIAPDHILTETCSYDTIGNAFFARVIHTDIRGLRKLLIITSEFHRNRTEIIFNWIFSLTPLKEPYELFFESVPDAGMSGNALELRREKEKTRIAQLRKLTKRIHTLKGFHEWLFTAHDAYSVSGEDKEKETGAILSTY